MLQSPALIVLLCVLTAAAGWSAAAPPANPVSAGPVPAGPTLRCDAARIWNIAVDDAPAEAPVTEPLYNSVYSQSVRGWVFEDGAWHNRFQVFYMPGGHPLAAQIAELCSRFYCYGADRLLPADGRNAQDPRGAFVTPVHYAVSADGASSEVPTSFYLDRQHPGGAKEWNGALYLFQAASPRNSIELVREVAHEFSHLTVPGIRGFDDPRAPEDWLNGYLGEALYMEWLGQDTDEAIVSNKEVAEWSAAREHALESVFLALGPDQLLRDPKLHYWQFAGMLFYLRRLYGQSLLNHVLHYCLDSNHQTPAEIALHIANAMVGSTAAAISVPGSLTTGVGASVTGAKTDAGALTLGVDKAVRVWVYLGAGLYKLKPQITGAAWRLRAARIGSNGRNWQALGPFTPAAPDALFDARGANGTGGEGWYLVQWRNVGATAATVAGWTWTTQPAP